MVKPVAVAMVLSAYHRVYEPEKFSAIYLLQSFRSFYPCDFSSLRFFCASAVLAQVDTGAISGVVSDRSGSVMPGAKVRIVQTETNPRPIWTPTNRASIPRPRCVPATTRSRSPKRAFAQKSQPFELRVQDRAEVNFQLEVGAATSEITVSASAPLLESETSSLGQVIEEKTITDLPLNGRNFIQLATLGRGHPAVDAHRRARQLHLQWRARGPKQLSARWHRQQEPDHGLRQELRANHSADDRRHPGIQGPDGDVLGRVRPGGRRSSQRDDEIRHQQISRQSLRVPAQLAISMRRLTSSPRAAASRFSSRTSSAQPSAAPSSRTAPSSSAAGRVRGS